MSPDLALNAEPVLTIVGLVRRFGRITALDGLDFRVETEEIVGLVGPNGSGKTTLLNIIAGSLRPNAGTVRFCGRDVTGAPAYRLARLGLARCSQIVQPLVGMSVREVVTVGALFGRDGRRRGVAAARDWADEMLARLRLEGQASRPAITLNIVDRKRLELARALAMEPRLLLLDEVMAGLTPPEFEAISEVVRGVRAGGVSVVVVEHVMRAITSLCERAVVLRQGKVLVEGPPSSVLQDARVIEAYLGRRYVATADADAN